VQARPPFTKPETTQDAAACCALCAEPANVALGCTFWTYMEGTKRCYMKVHVKFVATPHKAVGVTAGSIRPWPPGAGAE